MLYTADYLKNDERFNLYNIKPFKIFDLYLNDSLEKKFGQIAKEIKFKYDTSVKPLLESIMNDEDKFKINENKFSLIMEEAILLNLYGLNEKDVLKINTKSNLRLLTVNELNVDGISNLLTSTYSLACSPLSKDMSDNKYLSIIISEKLIKENNDIELISCICQFVEQMMALILNRDCFVPLSDISTVIDNEINYIEYNSLVIQNKDSISEALFMYLYYRTFIVCLYNALGELVVNEKTASDLLDAYISTYNFGDNEDLSSEIISSIWKHAERIYNNNLDYFCIKDNEIVEVVTKIINNKYKAINCIYDINNIDDMEDK